MLRVGVGQGDLPIFADNVQYSFTVFKDGMMGYATSGVKQA